MKKFTVIILSIIMLIAAAVIPASAANYTNGAFSVEIPDELIENKELALEYDMTMTWVSEDENFDFSLSIDANDDNYTYVNYSESDIRELYENYVGSEDSYHTFESGENITIAGFEGVRVDMTIDYLGVQTKHIVCAFSTKTEVYTLYFYVYDDAYLGYVDEIINTMTIDGKDYDAEMEGNIQYIVYLAVVMIVSAVISKIKKSRAKKKGVPVDYQPISNEDGSNVVFNPETDINSAEAAEAAAETEASYEAVSAKEATGFAAEEAEKERKEREELFK